MNRTPFHTIAIAVSAVTLTCFSGCSKQETPAPDLATPTVATVNYPLAYFAQRIGGEAITVHFPSIDGDPAFWEPQTTDILAYQQADLILLNGANYAKWIPRVSLAQARLVNTSAALTEQLLPLTAEITHTHGPSGDHAHGDTAFTTWLDPQLATQQAAAIRNTFAGKWPQHKSDFERGYQLLATDLKALDADAQAAFDKLGNRPLLGSHPVYQYLTRRYGLNMKSVHWEPDTAPDETMWQELDTLLATHPAKIMLWEDEPLAATKQALAAKGIQSIVFSPCGNRPATGDYLATMNSNIAGLQNLKQPE